jgi:hypothetical protein
VASLALVIVVGGVRPADDVIKLLEPTIVGIPSKIGPTRLNYLSLVREAYRPSAYTFPFRLPIAGQRFLEAW